MLNFKSAAVLMCVSPHCFYMNMLILTKVSVVCGLKYIGDLCGLYGQFIDAVAQFIRL